LEGFFSRETDWATIILFLRSHWRPYPIDTDLDGEWHPQGKSASGHAGDDGAWVREPFRALRQTTLNQATRRKKSWDCKTKKSLLKKSLPCRS
jgi:hypothetical protein